MAEIWNKFKVFCQRKKQLSWKTSFEPFKYIASEITSLCFLFFKVFFFCLKRNTHAHSHPHTISTEFFLKSEENAKVRTKPKHKRKNVFLRKNLWEWKECLKICKHHPFQLGTVKNGEKFAHFNIQKKKYY